MAAIYSFYPSSKAANADRANKQPKMIDEIKRTFSKPRLVYLFPPRSPPPKALPSPASERCKSTAPIMRTERIICMKGNNTLILSICREYSMGGK